MPDEIDEVEEPMLDQIKRAFEDPRGDKPVPDSGAGGAGVLSEVQRQGRDDAFPTTEAGDSEYFAHLMTGRLRYDHSRRRWFRFGPHQWHLDSTTQVMQAALKVMRCRQQQALTIADSNERKQRMEWALRGESEARLKHLLDLAATHPVLAVDGTDWDANPWVLGVQNGLVDLQTGTVRPGRPEDRVTKVAAVPYDSAATCPRWCGFVREVCNDDEDLAAFLQRSIGYALTGETGEQCFSSCLAWGRTGKVPSLKP